MAQTVYAASGLIKQERIIDKELSSTGAREKSLYKRQKKTNKAINTNMVALWLLTYRQTAT